MDLDKIEEDGLISGSNFCWSPNGSYMAVSVKHRILIQDSHTLSLKVTYSFGSGVNTIDSVQWSADSLFIAVASICQGYIFIRRLDKPHWKSSIHLGSKEIGVGLLHFEWSPDARHILTTASFYTQLTIWSLRKGVMSSFRNICPIQKYKSFCSNGGFLAIAQFDDEFKTCISIYESQEWTLKKRFAVVTKDLAGLLCSPTDSCIILWDSPLFSNLYVYTPSGELLKHYSPDGISLGIQYIVLSPTGQLLALINHRNTLKILNGLSFGVLLEEDLEFSFSQHYINKDCKVYCEMLIESDGLIIPKYELDKSWSWCTKTAAGSDRYAGNREITSEPSDAFKVSEFIKFSDDGKYFACRVNGYPNRLWIWDLQKVTLSTVLVQLQPITDFNWDPKHSRLVFCTGGKNIYFWTPNKSYIKSIQSLDFQKKTDFKADKISWNTQGISFAVQDLSLNTIILGFLNSKDKML